MLFIIKGAEGGRGVRGVLQAGGARRRGADLSGGELDITLQGAERVAAVVLDLAPDLRVKRHPIARKLHSLAGGKGNGKG